MVSILRTHYGHTGGTYPTLLYMADHFDLTTGEVLTFDDFFTDPTPPPPSPWRRCSARPPRGRQRHHLRRRPAESLFKRENFYLTAGAVVFFYQPQDLAPNAAGAPPSRCPGACSGPAGAWA